eukprot:COSAG05_NODE_1651_length_4337_cov_2.821142_2_plen_50_part_00
MVRLAAQERGLSFNCLSANVTVKGDEVLIYSKECSPFQLNEPDEAERSN